jgi:hypothetical protein
VLWSEILYYTLLGVFMAAGWVIGGNHDGTTTVLSKKRPGGREDVDIWDIPYITYISLGYKCKTFTKQPFPSTL